MATPLSWTTLFVCLVSLLAVRAQQLPVGTVPNVEKDSRSERAERVANGYNGYVFDFFSGLRQEPSSNGFQVQNNVNTNAWTHTLTFEGTSQNLLNLGPCAGNSPHNHPRGPEISIIVRGVIQFGFVEENGPGGNRLVVFDAHAGQVVHVPQGVMHFSHNQQCEPAAFIANFPTRDAGTQTTWHSLLAIPTPILAASLNLADNQVESERIINRLKARAMVSAPSTGGAECMARCWNSTAYGRQRDPNYYRLNGVLGAPQDVQPIIPNDQLGNPQTWSAGGVSNQPPIRKGPNGENFTRDDFLGWTTIAATAGYADGNRATPYVVTPAQGQGQDDTGSEDDTWSSLDRRRMMQTLEEAAADLPQDRITVMDLKDALARRNGKQ